MYQRTDTKYYTDGQMNGKTTHTLLLPVLLLLLPTDGPLLEQPLLGSVSTAVRESCPLGVATSGGFLGRLFIIGVSLHLVPQSLYSCDTLAS